ncbi:hypothetical protein GCM10027184_64700 [Saccharothrix stipae]
MVVAKSNKVGVDDVESSVAQAGHVLPHDPLGSEGGDDVGHRGPEPPVVRRSESETGERGGLAGESARDEVDVGAGSGPPPGGGGADVVMAVNLRPVLGEYLSAERVDLHLAHHVHPGAFQTQGQAADPGEQLYDVHVAPRVVWGTRWARSAVAVMRRGLRSGCGVG